MRLFTTSFFEGIPGAVIKLFTTDTTAVASFTRDFCTFCNFMSAERAFSERFFHIGKQEKMRGQKRRLRALAGICHVHESYF